MDHKQTEALDLLVVHARVFARLLETGWLCRRYPAHRNAIVKHYLGDAELPSEVLERPTPMLNAENMQQAWDGVLTLLREYNLMSEFIESEKK